MLHLGSATAREQRVPEANTAVHQGRLHSEQGALVGRVRAVVAPPAGDGAAAPHRVRARGARLPAQRRRALVRRRHALLAQLRLLCRRLPVLQPAQRLVRAVVPAAAPDGVRDAAVAAGHGVARRVARRVPRAARLARPRPAVCSRLSCARAHARRVTTERPTSGSSAFRFFFVNKCRS